MARHAGVTRRTTAGRLDDSAGRGAGAFRPRLSAGTERTRKTRIQVASELPRGVRQPANFPERESLNWAAPRKRAAQMALTGDVRMPHKAALHSARDRAGGFRTNKIGTTGTRRTFTGKTVRTREVVPPKGVRLTTRGRANLAKYGRD